MSVRVGVVTPRYPPVSDGGGERSAKLLADGLADSDRVSEVRVISFDGTDSGPVDGVQVERLGAPSSFVTEYQNLRAYPALRDVLPQFDVVHAYNMELHPVVGYLSDRLRVPSVATLNSYHFFPKRVSNVGPGRLERLYEVLGHPTTGRLLLAWMKRIDLFVALSHAVEEVYRSRSFAGSRIEVVPNMIDPSFSVPETDRSDHDVRLLYVGSLTANKGVEYLIDAMRLLPPSYSLRIVGSGTRGAALGARADRLGLSDRVDFAGQVPYDAIPSEYADADVFVHPGVWPEPLNRTVLEAMQAGLPVVCTDIGGPPEVIPDKTLLCPPEDAEALAATVRRASDLGYEAGEQNRQYVRRHLAPSVVVPQIVGLYEELIES